MARVIGDDSKRVEGCEGGFMHGEEREPYGGFKHCPNLKNTNSTYDSEIYECEVCGEYFVLYDEDMR